MYDETRRAPARSTTRSGRRRSPAALALLLAVTTVAAGTPAEGRPAGAPPPPAPAAPPTTRGEAVDPLAKVDAEVLDAVDAAPQQTTTFWVDLADDADLAAAEAIDDRAERGRYVVDTLQATAAASQAEVRARLDGLGATYTPYWISNRIRVTGTEQVVEAMAAEPAVEAVTAPTVVPIARARPSAAAEPSVEGVEWGVRAIRAPEVWEAQGVRGEGIVVAAIDTGSEAAHPALAAQYRGRVGGQVTHDYAWFDGYGDCAAPCDRAGHGTHVTGTMVGDDGDPGPNRVGVAPHARWIAARGCLTFSCSDDALLRSAQWILAPTDAAGANPRPDLRPHIVNNSWSADVGGDPWFQDVVAGWRAAGIFPMFAAGNDGPACGTVDSPGDYPDTYAAGSFDRNGRIAGDSARGASAFGGEVKPDLAAPGKRVRSTQGLDSYGSMSGTSMASPHVAGTVALMWSAAPQLIGRVDLTAQLLDGSARDTDDQQCGGTAEDNNVYGEGRLDALAAVEASTRVVPALVAGRATDAATSAPVASATVTVTGDGRERTTTTGPDGRYELFLLAGEYDLSVSAFYFETVDRHVVLVDGPQALDLDLVRLPVHEVAGRILGRSGPAVAGAEVTLVGTPLRAVTDAGGRYLLTGVPVGSYRLRVDASAEAGCLVDGAHVREVDLEVDIDELLDVELERTVDGFGYTCGTTPAAWVGGTTPVALTEPERTARIDLPFPVRFYGLELTDVYASAAGMLGFRTRPAGTDVRRGIPHPQLPHGGIFPFWADLSVDGQAAVLTGETGEGADRRFVVEWRNVLLRGFGERFDMAVLLAADSTIVTQYRRAGRTHTNGIVASIGIEDTWDRWGLAFGVSRAVLPAHDFAVRYVPPPPDVTPPTATITSPFHGARYRLGEVVTAAYTCADDAIPEPLCTGNVPVGEPIYTAAPGTYDFAVTAIDGSGNEEGDLVRYTVLGCNGLAPTIVGSDGDDVIVGTAGDDVIVDLWGDNVIRSRSGNDTICTGPGADTVESGLGDDWVLAGDGDNLVVTTDGDDKVGVGSGDDEVRGGAGADLIAAGSGANLIVAGQDADHVYTLDGDDTIDSGTGSDVVYAGGGANRVDLSDGDDAVFAGPGNDTLSGGRGTDRCAGGGGTDTFRLCELA